MFGLERCFPKTRKQVYIHQSKFFFDALIYLKKIKSQNEGEINQHFFARKVELNHAY